MSTNREYQICSKTIMDTTDPKIIFDKNGVSDGSLFVFKGVYKAVLINYPTQKDKENLIKENFEFLKKEKNE